MEIKSLGRQTSLIFGNFSGSVIDRGTYTAVKTPSNPDYHWGNYIVFNHAPQKGDLKVWTEIFDQEFDFYDKPHHYVFTWDTGSDQQGDVEEFLKSNFELDTATVLTTRQVIPPPYLNIDLTVRKVVSESDWNEIIKLQNLCADPKYMNHYYEQFKQKQMTEYRKMSEAGMGSWFGGFLKGKLVGDLGIFFDKGLARYQSVGTHPDFRKKGICGTLVYLSGLAAFKDFGVKTLVMEADVHYHAARIYESVGFKRSEVNHSLSWWKQTP